MLLISFLGLLLHFFPRNKKVWLFGAAQNKFIDNSKYLFIYVNSMHKDVRPIWLTASKEVIYAVRSMGFQAYHRWSLRGLWFAASAKYWFYTSYVSDINYYFRSGACLINLWHGTPFKKIEFDIDNGPLFQLYHNPGFIKRWITYAGNFVRPDYLISSSHHVSNAMFSSAFRLEMSQCLNFGYPRNDILYQDVGNDNTMLTLYGLAGAEGIIQRMKSSNCSLIYMPTWREHNPNFIKQLGVDFKSLDHALSVSNRILLLKLHINTPTEDLAEFHALENIVLLDPSWDVYPLLCYTDALITDYSSIAFDYLHLNKPMAFYMWDCDDYKNKSRSMYMPFDEYTVGEVLKTGLEFESYVERFDLSDNSSSRRQVQLERFFTYADGGASERIVQHIKRL